MPQKRPTSRKTKTTKKLSKLRKPTPVSFWDRSYSRLVVVLLVGALAGGGLYLYNHFVNHKPPLVPGQTHHSAALALTAVYPKGWKIDDSKAGSFIPILTATEPSASDTDQQSLLTVAREPVDGNLDKVGKELLELDSTDKIDHTKIVKQWNLTVAGVPAKARETTSDFDHEELIVAVDSDNIGYLITFSTSESKWAKQQPLLDTFVRTVKLDAPTHL